MKIYLFRHGLTEANARRAYAGVTDTLLTEEGKSALKESDIKTDVVYITPLTRTKKTADIMFPGAKKVVVEGFGEMNFGIFEDRSYKGDLEFDKDYQIWLDTQCMGPIPGGEQVNVFADRVSAAFVRLSQDTEDDKLVIVSHGGTIMALLHVFSNPHRDFYDWMPENGCGYPADWDGQFLTNIEKLAL